MKPTDLTCHQQVAAVIGEAYADHELQRVLDCELYKHEEKYTFGFIWRYTPQGGEFWNLIKCEQNPYEHGHNRPELSEITRANSDKIGARLVLEEKSISQMAEDVFKKAESMGFGKERSKVTAERILEAGLGHMQDRAVTYDNPHGERSIGKTVDMFNVLYGLELTEEQGWAFMNILKLVRTSQGEFKLDNFEDMAAYAGLMGEAAAKGAEK